MWGKIEINNYYIISKYKEKKSFSNRKTMQGHIERQCGIEYAEERDKWDNARRFSKISESQLYLFSLEKLDFWFLSSDFVPSRSFSSSYTTLFQYFWCSRQSPTTCITSHFRSIRFLHHCINIGSRFPAHFWLWVPPPANFFGMCYRRKLGFLITQLLGRRSSMFLLLMIAMWIGRWLRGCSRYLLVKVCVCVCVDCRF